MTTARRNISSGSHLEEPIGFSRAVRIGPYIAVAGTAPIAEGGGTTAPGDVEAQTRRCIEIAATALAEAGADLADVIRTRIMLTDINTWEGAARAHGAAFGDIRPACTFVEVSRFIDPEWLVEVEMDAVVERDAGRGTWDADGRDV
jgi:enamine deaminase RidA (YjgF/YER057c/UK114 family)